MSFSFFVDAASAPTFSAVVDAIAEPAWECTEQAPADDRFPPGYCFHPYVRGRSARGIELSLEDAAFHVRVMTCSSRADLELALQCIQTIARMTGGRVRPEDGVSMSAAEVAGAFGDEWIDRMVLRGAESVLLLVEHDGHSVTMSGAKRDVHVGPRFVAELRGRPGDMTAAEQLVAAFVRIQNVDEERWYPATPFRVTPKDKTADDAFTLAVWAPDVAYLMPGVQLFALPGDDGEILVPHEAAPLLAEARWTFLDEKNALVEAVPQRDWSDFLRRATAYAHTFKA